MSYKENAKKMKKVTILVIDFPVFLPYIWRGYIKWAGYFGIRSLYFWGPRRNSFGIVVPNKRKSKNPSVCRHRMTLIYMFMPHCQWRCSRQQSRINLGPRRNSYILVGRAETTSTLMQLCCSPCASVLNAMFRLRLYADRPVGYECGEFFAGLFA